MLKILTETDGRSVEEIANIIGIKKEAVYHILELLSLIGIVEKRNEKYYSKYKEVAELVLISKKLDDFKN